MWLLSVTRGRSRCTADAEVAHERMERWRGRGGREEERTSVVLLEDMALVEGPRLCSLGMPCMFIGTDIESAALDWCMISCRRSS